MSTQLAPSAKARMAAIGEVWSRAEMTQLVAQRPHLDGEQLTACLAGRPSAHYQRRLRNSRTLIGYRVVRRGYLYPEFQFDIERGRLHSFVATANRELVACFGDAGALVWWLTQRDDDPSGPVAAVLRGDADTLAAMVADAVLRHTTPSLTPRMKESILP